MIILPCRQTLLSASLVPLIVVLLGLLLMANRYAAGECFVAKVPAEAINRCPDTSITGSCAHEHCEEDDGRCPSTGSDCREWVSYVQKCEFVLGAAVVGSAAGSRWDTNTTATCPGRRHRCTCRMAGHCNNTDMFGTDIPCGMYYPSTVPCGCP